MSGKIFIRIAIKTKPKNLPILKHQLALTDESKGAFTHLVSACFFHIALQFIITYLDGSKPR